MEEEQISNYIIYITKTDKILKLCLELLRKQQEFKSSGIRYQQSGGISDIRRGIIQKYVNQNVFYLNKLINILVNFTNYFNHAKI